MGSAQSARRIQPGGGSGRVGGPADLSRPPFLPTPPPALPSPRRPSSSSPEGAGSGGCGGGRAGPGVGSAGDRPPTGDRPPPGAFPPRRCAATGSGTAGKARRGRWLGGPRPSSSSSHPVSAPRPRVLPREGARVGAAAAAAVAAVAAGPKPPRVLQPPGSSTRRIPGPRERDPSPRSPPSRRPPPRGYPPRGGSPPRGRAGVSSWGGRATPPTARPLSHPSSPQPPSPGDGGGPRAGRGAGRTVPSAPRAGRAVGPGGEVLSGPRARPPKRGTAEPSARGRRRCRPPTRPVLKHGPRSLTRARVGGSHESRRGAMKVKAGARSPAEVGSRGLSSPPRAHHRPVSPAAPGRWSTSARVRTRKMVNYAWAGRSQRKLWWRSVAVLTCKSVVRPGYRGERLIEPSSSWFPPKFPSG